MRKISNLIAMIVLLALLCACSGVTEIRIEDFKDENGVVSFPGVPLGITLAELETAINTEFGKPVVGNQMVEDYHDYISYSRITFVRDLESCDILLLDNYGQAQYDIYKGKLEEVRVLFRQRDNFKQERGNDLETLAKALPDALVMTLGDGYEYTHSDGSNVNEYTTSEGTNVNRGNVFDSYFWQEASPDGTYVSCMIRYADGGETILSILLTIGRAIAD